MHGAKRSASLSSFTLLIAHAGSASRNDTLIRLRLLTLRSVRFQRRSGRARRW
jgi:hypothetical protein